MQTPFAIGERIGGKYRVESVIGEGGMGVVLAARHEALDLRVAVKLLRRPCSRRPRCLARRGHVVGRTRDVRRAAACGTRQTRWGRRSRTAQTARGTASPPSVEITEWGARK